MKNVLAWVIMPQLDPRDICAVAQVCKLWNSAAATYLQQSMHLPHMLSHYAKMGLYDAYMRFAIPTPDHITLAIMHNREEFVQACNIPSVSVDTRLNQDSINLKQYLHTCIITQRDRLFTKLYMLGGWYHANRLIPIAAGDGSMHALRMMSHHTIDAHVHFDAIIAADMHHRMDICKFLFTLRKPIIPDNYKLWIARIERDCMVIKETSSDVDVDDNMDLFG
jgi:hypothetical protein